MGDTQDQDPEGKKKRPPFVDQSPYNIKNPEDFQITPKISELFYHLGGYPFHQSVPNEDNGVLLDALLKTLLAKNGGVMLGEAHIAPAAREAITMLMPTLKLQGVSCISFETDQRIIDNLLAAKNIEEVKQTYPRLPHAESLYMLVQSAKKQGIIVLGHENPNTGNGHDYFMLSEDKIEEIKTMALKIEEISLDPEKFHERNTWSAEYIKKHRPKEGKVIAIVGAKHTSKLEGNEGKKGPDVGLNVMLGIPSIDTLNIYEPEFKDVGNTYRVKDNSADFGFVLPLSIKETFEEKRITSWPPAPGPTPPGAKTPRER